MVRFHAICAKGDSAEIFMLTGLKVDLFLGPLAES